jgi:hypothetical protein
MTPSSAPPVDVAIEQNPASQIPPSMEYRSSMMALMEGQNYVLELIAQGKPLATVLDALALLIEAQTTVRSYSWRMASVYVTGLAPVCRWSTTV